MTFEKSQLSDQWRTSQPKNLVPLCKFQIIIIIHFFRNCCFHSQKKSLQDVLYLLDLERKLVSVQAMFKLGATVKFSNNDCMITRNATLPVLD